MICLALDKLVDPGQQYIVTANAASSISACWHSVDKLTAPRLQKANLIPNCEENGD